MNKILSYLTRDRLLHIVFSTALVVIFNLIFSWVIAAILALMVGLGKEFIWDKWMKKGTFDIHDIISDIIGIILGIL